MKKSIKNVCSALLQQIITIINQYWKLSSLYSNNEITMK